MNAYEEAPGQHRMSSSIVLHIVIISIIFLVWLDQMVSKPQGSTYVFLPSTGVTHADFYVSTGDPSLESNGGTAKSWPSKVLP